MSKRICVVDDQPALRQMLRFALNFQGVDVLEAENGVDALEKISNNDVDMLIVDWQMPVMDGLALVRQLRKIKAYTDLPVVIVSCRDDLKARQEARSLGVVTWLKKPFRISEIQVAVDKALLSSARDVLPDVATRYS